MARGRKSKPTALKLLEGNPGKRALNKKEPKPKKVDTKCPKEFGIKRFEPSVAGEKDRGFRAPQAAKVAAGEFKRLSKELAALELLTVVDTGMLEAYCQAYGLWKEASAYVNRYGPVLFSKDGGMYQNPYLAVVNKQAALMAKIGSEYGLTPSSRTGLEVKSGEEEDGLMALLSRRNRREQGKQEQHNQGTSG